MSDEYQPAPTQDERDLWDWTVSDKDRTRIGKQQKTLPLETIDRSKIQPEESYKVLNERSNISLSKIP
jgi:hypothetical protein